MRTTVSPGADSASGRPAVLAAEAPISACLERLVRGDATALADVFAQFSAEVHRVAFAITLSADDADDVVQDVFIGLPEALGGYDERGRFGAWLRIIAARTALMRRRSTRRRADLSMQAHDSRDRPQELVERLALESALATLPDDMRAVFVLKVIEGYTHEEIAHQLGIRRGTAEVRLFRAIRRLRAVLDED